MRPLSEIKANRHISLMNVTVAPLLKLGCPIALDGEYVDPVSRKSWFFVFSVEPTFEHLSVSGRNKTPDWDTMCRIKDVFFGDEEECVQFHPPKSDYVNMHEHCLHIWRYRGELPQGWYQR